MSESHRSGPVRSDAARRAVLEATAELFEELGYDQLTIEGIARRARVGKQTVYRWWGSKGELIAECLFEGLLLRDTVAPPDTGDLRQDIMSWLDNLFTLLSQPRGEDLLRSLVAAAAEHAEVGRRLGAAVAGEHPFTARLQSAVEQGRPADGGPPVDLTEVLVAIVMFRAVTRGSLDHAEAARLVEALLLAAGDGGRD